MAGISQTRTIWHCNTAQRVIRNMQYSPILRHISAPAVCTQTLAEGVHLGDLWRSAQPRHTCAALIILLLISPTSEGWKAESSLPPPGFEPRNTGLWIQRLNHCTFHSHCLNSELYVFSNPSPWEFISFSSANGAD